MPSEVPALQQDRHSYGTVAAHRCPVAKVTAAKVAETAMAPRRNQPPFVLQTLTQTLWKAVTPPTTRRGLTLP